MSAAKDIELFELIAKACLRNTMKPGRKAFELTRAFAYLDWNTVPTVKQSEDSGAYVELGPYIFDCMSVDSTQVIHIDFPRLKKILLVAGIFTTVDVDHIMRLMEIW